ncbi:MAG TPA: adenylate kinase, partial [Thermoanaerobacterales bacterium]|nr:adenylate kinase [Thermoanaerobacterales bacterium]
ETEPLIKYYTEKDALMTIDGRKDSEEVFQALKQAVRRCN